jgi:hypothetical protein
MKKNTHVGLILIGIIIVVGFVIAKNYTKAPVTPVQTEDPQSHLYTGTGFSIRLPNGYTTDESYTYQALGPGKDILGTKFIIPASIATGTNLSNDSYISVEQIPNVSDCSASLFVSPGTVVKKVIENTMTYSVATSNDAGAGNRYDVTVYALPGTSPCLAVRYFIHYSAYENYPPGTITKFDEGALVAQFDQIRRTLVVY